MTAKWVWVTGGNRGLGLAISSRLLAGGYSVLVAARKRTEAVDQLLETYRDRFAFRTLDLAQLAELHPWCTAAVKEFGAPYALINNAAVAHDGVLGTMHESQITETIMVNVTATLILTKYVSRSMLRQRNGRIVNISSIIASTGFNGLSVYAASKAALNGFTKSLSRELGKAGITVNSVAPGYMKTDMSAGIDDAQMEQITRRSALRRLATTDEAASVVEYLLSEAAGAVTGTILTVDAGNTA
jgi:3-oxoacyl-[acyl-carrier protein] reductase